MTMKNKEKPTEEQIARYIADHTNEDWPMEQTIRDFYDKVLAYSKIVGEKEQFNSEGL